MFVFQINNIDLVTQKATKIPNFRGNLKPWLRKRLWRAEK